MLKRQVQQYDCLSAPLDELSTQTNTAWMAIPQDNISTEASIPCFGAYNRGYMPEAATLIINYIDVPGTCDTQMLIISPILSNEHIL